MYMGPRKAGVFQVRSRHPQKLNFSFGSRRSYEVETLQIQGPLYIAARILAL